MVVVGAHREELQGVYNSAWKYGLIIVHYECEIKGLLNHFYEGQNRSAISDILYGDISKQANKNPTVNIIYIELLFQATISTDAIKNECTCAVYMKIKDGMLTN